jgi:tetratricopeptide (TPR) repeat protein
MKQPALLLACAWLAASGNAVAKPYCGDLNNAFGPFDYRTASQGDKNLVEGAHFTEEVQHGIKGNTGPVGGDLDYTLRVFPNHPRALNTLNTLAMRAPGKPIQGMRYPVECWFERAVRFQPDDGNAWMLFASYLYSIGQKERAQPMLEKAAALDPDSPSINYNLGLAYAKQGLYDKALPYAHKAYQREFPLPGLKQILEKAGVWTEPPAPAAGTDKPDQPDSQAAAQPAASAPPTQP